MYINRMPPHKNRICGGFFFEGLHRRAGNRSGKLYHRHKGDCETDSGQDGYKQINGAQGYNGTAGPYKTHAGGPGQGGVGCQQGGETYKRRACHEGEVSACHKVLT